MIKKEDIIKELENIFGNKFIYDKVKDVNTCRDLITLECVNHGEIIKTLSNFRRGRGCKKCSDDKQRSSTEETIEKFKKVHGEKFIYDKVDYKGCQINVEIECREHGIFLQRPNNHFNGQGCPKCCKISIDEFVEKSNIVHNFKYTYEKTQFNTIVDKIIITCPEHNDFEQIAHNHMTNGNGCPYCNKEERRMTTEEFINKANIIHNFRYKYDETNYVLSCEKVIINCKTHGNFKQKANAHLTGTGCPDCNLSKGELAIKNILDNNCIIYERQKTFEDCKYISLLKYDFYLSDYNLCIEYDGIQHYESVDFWGGEESLKENQIKDNIKTKFCINNNINILRIPYFNFKNIDNILKEKLNIS